MNRASGSVGILVPEGPDRALICDLVEGEGWHPRFPLEESEPEGPWRHLDAVVVDWSWLDRARPAILRSKEDAGSEFFPVLLVAHASVAPDEPPESCDELLVYPTTRTGFVTRLRTLLQARLESRRVYRSFFENAVVGVYRASMDGRILMANDALAQMLGYAGGEELRADDVRIPELQRAATDGAGPLVRELEERGEAEAVPGVWNAGARGERHVLHSARLVRGSAHADTRPVVEGTVEDVTVLVEASEQLARSERFLQGAIDALSAHVAILSPEGTIVGVNEAWRRFEADTRPHGTDDVGTNYLDVCAGSEDAVAQQVADGIRDVIDGRRRVFQMEYPCHSPTQYRWFRVVVTAFPEAPPRRTVVAHEDVTEIKRVQRHFQLLIEGSSEITLVVGDRGVVKYRSPSWASFTGHADVEGEQLVDFVHPGDREIVGRLSEMSASEGTVDFRIRRADGAWRDMEWSVADLRGQPLVHGWVLHGRDVTERLNMAAELQLREGEILQMQKMEAVGRLAGGVAHDFNNLLTTVQGNLELSQAAITEGTEVDVEELSEYLSEIARATEQGSFLTRRLLVFSRKELTAEPAVQDINELLRGLAKMLRRLLPESIAIELDLSSEPLEVRVLPGEVEQVVVNLAVNAADAMEGGGSFTLRTYRVVAAGEGEGSVLPADLEAGRYAAVEAVDTGTGVPAELQQKIFEPFFTTKAQGKGTGLGLATTYGILTRAGGSIAVYSEPGLGSRFTAYWPLEVSDELHEEDGQEMRGAHVAGGETLLLVEDEDSVRMVARRGLERHGYTVLEAEHGKAALELLAGENGDRISLVVTDFVMPVMAGLELARAVHERRPELPVLITSGYSDVQIDLPESLHWRTLSKPYDLQELASCVGRMIAGE